MADIQLCRSSKYVKEVARFDAEYNYGPAEKDHPNGRMRALVDAISLDWRATFEQYDGEPLRMSIFQANIPGLQMAKSMCFTLYPARMTIDSKTISYSVIHGAAPLAVGTAQWDTLAAYYGAAAEKIGDAIEGGLQALLVRAEVDGKPVQTAGCYIGPRYAELHAEIIAAIDRLRQSEARGKCYG